MRTFEIVFTWSSGHADIVYHVFTTPTMHGITPDYFYSMMQQTVDRDYDSLTDEQKNYISEYLNDLFLSDELGTFYVSSFRET